MLLTNSQIREVLVQLKPKFSDGLQRIKPLWDFDRLASTDTADQGEVVLHWLDRLPSLRDWTGISKEIVNFSERGLRIRMRDYERTVGIAWKELQRANKRQVKISLNAVVQAAARFKYDLVASAIYNNGLSVNPKHPRPDTYVGYDGVGLFGTHPINPDFALTDTIRLPVSDATTVNSQSNLVAATPMSAAGWQTAQQVARGFRDPLGINLGVHFDTVVVPPQLVEAAREAVAAKFIPVFPNTTSGATKSNINEMDAPQIICIPELDDGSAASKTTWYAFCTEHPSGIKPFEVMTELAPVFGTNMDKVMGLSSYEEILTEQVLMACTARAVGYATMWFLAAKFTA